MADKELGARLKEARTRINKSQAEVCDLLDIPKVQTLSAYERGVNSPPIETLKRLADLYDVSADYLLFGRAYTAPITKNDKYYMTKLVEAGDKLQCPITMVEDDTTMPWETPVYCIQIGGLISCDQMSRNAVQLFLDKWAQLRRARSSGAIDWDDYNSIITKRLEEIPDDIEFLASFAKFPF